MMNGAEWMSRHRLIYDQPVTAKMMGGSFV